MTTLADIELGFRLEKWIKNRMKETIYQDYEVYLNIKSKEDVVYQCIQFRHEENVIDKTHDEFWHIIKQIEEKRTIASYYERMKQHLETNDPELFDENVPITVGGVNEHILVAAILCSIFVTFMSTPTGQTFRSWVVHLFNA